MRSRYRPLAENSPWPCLECKRWFVGHYTIFQYGWHEEGVEYVAFICDECIEKYATKQGERK